MQKSRNSYSPPIVPLMNALMPPRDRAARGNEAEAAGDFSRRPISSSRLSLNGSRSLKRYCALAATAAWLVLLSGPVALADCKDDVRDLRQDINNDRNNYTADSRAEAKKELAKAEAVLLKPVECREHLRKARQALKKQ
jgi:hypothetical protein